MPPPAYLSTVYATDEDVLALAGSDFQVICPPWSKFAEGTDGVFAMGSPWVLTSASNDFVAQGLAANMVIQLRGPAAHFKGGGDLMAIETVAQHSLTLRRPGEGLGSGMPPAPAAGLTGVSFLVTSLKKQLEDVSYQLNEQFSIDPALPNRAPGDIYDLRAMRRLVVYQVAYRQYLSVNRSAKGDFADKVAYYRDLYETEKDSTVLRWGPLGTTQESSGVFSTRVSR